MINVRMPNNKEVQKLSPKITVLGVGGAGGNAVNNMISSGLQGCEFVVCNTDAQALGGSLSENKVQLGVSVTGGLGAGAKPEIGCAAAEESIEEVAAYLEGSNMAFITAGMGGGTGTGAAPVIAKICRDLGVLTVGVVTKPFHFEGTHRMKMAEAGIHEMQQYVDTLIVIPNQNLFRVANEKTTFAEAFKMADSVLQSGVRGVTDLMVMPGLINLDFADVRSAMLEMGKAMMGTGEAEGDRRAIEAAESAINNPLLDDVSMKGARGVIINVTGGLDMTLFEVDEACNRIRDEVDPNANIIFGSTFDEKLDGMMRVSVVATGIEAEIQKSSGKNYTGSLVNSVTGQERKMERAQPNVSTISAARTGNGSVQSKGEVSSFSTQTHIPDYGPVTASAMSHAAALAATKKSDEPEADMFKQKALEAASVNTEQSARQWEQTAPQQQQSWRSAEPQSGMLRGSVYNNSFIPPKAAEPETRPDLHPNSYYDSARRQNEASETLAAQRPVYTEPPVQSITASGLNLRPPMPGGGAHKKKPPSLFERFTNPLRPHQDFQEDHKRQQGESSSGQGSSAGGGYAPALRAPQRDVQMQGSLNIETPKPETSEDELDIPAFLRRQAN